MTKNNIKIALFVSLMVVMILPFSAMNVADAIPNENANERAAENKGKLYIQDVKDKKNNIEELNNLHKIVKNEKSSKSGKDIASKRMNEIKEQFENQGKISEQRHMEIRGHIDSVTEKIDDLTKIHNIAIVTVGTDYENDSLRIGIDREGLTDSKIENVEKQIRKIVGDEISITIEHSDPAYFRCSQTSNCNPMQGGVKIQAEGVSHCSMGYKATYNSKVGFIMAGHCLQNTAVGQKVYNYNSWWQDDLLGSVVKNTFSSPTTSCDCAFVEETELDESISDKVFSNVSLSGLELPVQFTWAYFEGFTTKGSFAGITDVGVTKVIEGITVVGLVETNGIIDGGDSGGTVYEGFASGTPKFMGIITASPQQSNTPGFYTPYTKIQGNFNGITFG